MLNCKNEDIANKIYKVIYLKSSVILFDLSYMEIDQKDYERVFPKELEEYKDIFINRLSYILKVAIDNNCINFIKKINIFYDLFILPLNKYSSYKKCDEKVFYLFKDKIDFQVRLDKYLIDKNQFEFNFLKSFFLFLPNNYISNKHHICEIYKNFEKYIIYHIVECYKYIIENRQSTVDVNFNILKVQILHSCKNGKLKNFKIFVSILTYLINYMCCIEKHISESANIKNSINILFDIVKHEIIIKASELYKNYINSKLKILLSNHKDIKYIKNEIKDSKIDDIDILNEYSIGLETDLNIDKNNSEMGNTEMNLSTTLNFLNNIKGIVSSLELDQTRDEKVEKFFSSLSKEDKEVLYPYIVQNIIEINDKCKSIYEQIEQRESVRCTAVEMVANADNFRNFIELAILVRLLGANHIKLSKKGLEIKTDSVIKEFLKLIGKSDEKK